MKLFAGTTTSDPGGRASPSSTISSASVPLPTPMQWLAPAYCAKAASKSALRRPPTKPASASTPSKASRRAGCRDWD